MVAKDFEAMAAVVREDMKGHTYAQRTMTAMAMARAARKVSKYFDTERFYMACGLSEFLEWVA